MSFKIGDSVMYRDLDYQLINGRITGFEDDNGCFPVDGILIHRDALEPAYKETTSAVLQDVINLEVSISPPENKRSGSTVFIIEEEFESAARALISSHERSIKEDFEWREKHQDILGNCCVQELVEYTAKHCEQPSTYEDVIQEISNWLDTMGYYVTEKSPIDDINVHVAKGILNHAGYTSKKKLTPEYCDGICLGATLYKQGKCENLTEIAEDIQGMVAYMQILDYGMEDLPKVGDWISFDDGIGNTHKSKVLSVNSAHKYVITAPATNEHYTVYLNQIILNHGQKISEVAASVNDMEWLLPNEKD